MSYPSQFIDVLGVIARGSSLEDSLRRLARQHEELVPGQRSSIMRLDGANRTLHLLAAPGLPESWTRAFEALLMGRAAGASHTAAWRGETVVCADIATDPLWDGMREVALAHHVHAIWSVPIRSERGEVLGLFGCCADAPRSPSKAELELTLGAAQIAAVAMERQRMESTESARLTLAVRAASVGLWDWDLTTNRVYFSPEWKSQLGYEDSELENEFETWRSRVHPDDLGPVMKRVQEYIANPRPGYQSELRLRHRDGSWRWIHADASMLYDAEGRPQRMLGSHVDVTERRLQEDQIRAHAQRLQRVSRELLEVEAAERRGLARELHDRVGQNLSSLLLNLALMRRILPQPHSEEVKRRLDDTERLLDLTVTEVRSMLQDLRPAELDDFGLLRALQFHAQSLGQRAGFAVVAKGPQQPLSLHPGAETAVYRIVLESLTNIAKHARAKHVTLAIESNADGVDLSVEDDGCGLPDQVVGLGRGLRGMRERAEALGASLDLRRREEGGTRFSLHVPRHVDSQAAG